MAKPQPAPTPGDRVDGSALNKKPDADIGPGHRSKTIGTKGRTLSCRPGRVSVHSSRPQRTTKEGAAPGRRPAHPPGAAAAAPNAHLCGQPTPGQTNGAVWALLSGCGAFGAASSGLLRTLPNAPSRYRAASTYPPRHDQASPGPPCRTSGSPRSPNPGQEDRTQGQVADPRGGANPHRARHRIPSLRAMGRHRHMGPGRNHPSCLPRRSLRRGRRI